MLLFPALHCPMQDSGCTQMHDQTVFQLFSEIRSVKKSELIMTHQSVSTMTVTVFHPLTFLSKVQIKTDPWEKAVIIKSLADAVNITQRGRTSVWILTMPDIMKPPTAKHHKSAMLLMDCGGSKLRSSVRQHAVHSAPDNYFTSCSLCCDATRCVQLRGIVHIGSNRRPKVSICWSAVPQDCRISAPVTNDVI